MQVIPAILSASRSEVADLLAEIRISKKFERVQVDFVDGEYAANTTIRPAEVGVLPYHPLKFDAHLMAISDTSYIWSRMAKKVGYERIIAQVESVSDPEEYSCLALDIHSPVTALLPYLSKLDLIVLMAVEPGFSGQKFDGRVFDKITRFNELRKRCGYRYKICVDGGVEKEMLSDIENAGADEVAVGVRRAFEF